MQDWPASKDQETRSPQVGVRCTGSKGNSTCSGPEGGPSIGSSLGHSEACIQKA